MPTIKYIANYVDGRMKPKEMYSAKLKEYFDKLLTYQNNKLKKLVESGQLYEPKDYLRDLEIEIKYYYKKRNVDQNALMWSLYGIIANEMSQDNLGYKDKQISIYDLYEQDLLDYAERNQIVTTRKNFIAYWEEYERLEYVEILGSKYQIDTPEKIKVFLKIELPPDTEMKLSFIRSTSKLNTVEMANWINMLFNRLSYMGVHLDTSADIGVYWQTWRDMLNKEEIILNDEIMTIDEYKENNPICEATGGFIGNGGGELSHIKSVGMGNDRTKEPKKNYTSNWLHLSSEAHRLWHEKGREEFLKKFPHLSTKVNHALKRDYAPIDDQTENIIMESADELDELF